MNDESFTSTITLFNARFIVILVQIHHISSHLCAKCNHTQSSASSLSAILQNPRDGHSRKNHVQSLIFTMAHGNHAHPSGFRLTAHRSTSHAPFPRTHHHFLILTFHWPPQYSQGVHITTLGNTPTKRSPHTSCCFHGVIYRSEKHTVRQFTDRWLSSLSAPNVSSAR